MVFLSKDGKCLWDASGESIDAECSDGMGLPGYNMAHALAMIHGIYSRAAARLLFRSPVADPKASGDSAAPRC